jgi:hypothetical protein
MSEMSDSIKHEAAVARYYKQKYKRGKKSGASESVLSHIEFKYKRVKKKAKIFAAQYEKLKIDLGYKSPEELDGSCQAAAMTVIPSNKMQDIVVTVAAIVCSVYLHVYLSFTLPE